MIVDDIKPMLMSFMVMSTSAVLQLAKLWCGMWI